MTDREPLRVGPLVLRWRAENWADLSLVRGGFIRLTQREHPWSTEWHLELMFIGLDIDALYEDLDEAIETARHALQLTGYLAQYRSRRRLLARECERRSKWRERNADSARSAFLNKRAAKYARWAERLRNG